MRKEERLKSLEYEITIFEAQIKVRQEQIDKLEGF